MTDPRLPGFTGDASVYGVRNRAVRFEGADRREPTVVPQIINTGFGGHGGLGLHWPTWCEAGCTMAFYACCGKSPTPAGIAVCLTLDAVCLAKCNSYSGGGPAIA